MSPKSITLELFPAREGDCILVTCTNGDHIHRILFDGGRAATYPDLREALGKLPEDERDLDLLIVTHVDRDHIEGVLKLLEDEDHPVTFKDVWFNGFHHLRDEENFGAVMGEALTTYLTENNHPWNKAWGSNAVVLDDDTPLPSKQLGEITLTLLSPDRAKCLALVPKWIKECKKAGLIPFDPGEVPAEDEVEQDEETFGPPDVEALAAQPFEDDTAEPNGSSIAVLLEYGRHALLLTGDAHVDRLKKSLHALGATKESPLSLSAFKLSHHGSSHNVSRELLELVDCNHYIVSTNGSQFKHPKADAIARILKFGGSDKTLAFNYDTEFTQPWNQKKLREQYGYTTEYGEDGHYVAVFADEDLP